jgi:CRP-like cAMP-binding protein
MELLIDSARRGPAGRKPSYVSQAYEGGNRLLDCIPSAERSIFQDALHVAAFAIRDEVVTQDESPREVLFPIDCIFSIVALLQNGTTIEVGTVGREGFVPGEAIADAPLALRSTFCQVPGRAAVMERGAFERAFAAGGTFALLVRRNAASRLYISEQLTACNLVHSIVQRCARWLLMTRDRVGREEFPLTHESLAMMLGVRRAGVTEAAGQLQALGAIRYRRGHITLVDRGLLLARSCECYAATTGIVEAALDCPPDRLLGSTGTEGMMLRMSQQRDA